MRSEAPQTDHSNVVWKKHTKLIKLLVVLFVVFVYLLLSPLMGSGYELEYMALTLVPVIMASWLLGWTGMVTVTVSLVTYTRYQLISYGLDDMVSISEFGTIMRIGVLALTGAVVAYFSNLQNKYNEQVRVLEDTKKALVDKTSQLKESESVLREKTETLLEQNKKQESTKRAMLNLLEDAKVLEEELRSQKEMVEKRIEEQTQELKEEEARLVSSIESLPIGYVLTDSNDNVIMTNQATAKLLGNPTDKPLIDYLEEIFDLRERCGACRLTKRPYGPEEIEVENKFYRIHLTPVLTSFTADEDDVAGIVILIEDITEEKMLRRTRDEFFAVASHELRTPLTAIRGNVEIIRDYYADELSEELQESMNDIHSSSVRLIEVVNDFLDVSRLEQKKIEFVLEDFGLQKVGEKVEKDLHITAEQKGVGLLVESDGEVPEVYGDRMRVEQVIYNLVGNAIKFTEEGNVQMELSSDDKFVTFKVIDSGKGIPKKNQKLLFRKFQQAESSFITRDATQSTGMGLYISKLLIEGMGGKIFLERSEEGKGSTFTFTLPIANSKKN